MIDNQTSALVVDQAGSPLLLLRCCVGVCHCLFVVAELAAGGPLRGRSSDHSLIFVDSAKLIETPLTLGIRTLVSQFAQCQDCLTFLGDPHDRQDFATCPKA